MSQAIASSHPATQSIAVDGDDGWLLEGLYLLVAVLASELLKEVRQGLGAFLRHHLLPRFSCGFLLAEGLYARQGSSLLVRELGVYVQKIERLRRVSPGGSRTGLLRGGHLTSSVWL
jgi:hypothetical protein